jgi:hypothetical protein
MITQKSTLDEVLAHLWGRLTLGASDGKHAYHFPVLATLGAGKVQQRTVVLRKVETENRSLYCYTDIRAAKVKDIQDNTQAQWLFYDPKSREQIRIESCAQVHHQDDLTRKIWNDTPPSARGDYLGSMAPGMLTETYTPNLPQAFIEGDPSIASTEKGYQHFCVLFCEVSSIDFLALRKSGHIRTKFRWESDQWHSSWLAP